jgi:hypothetical protein
LPTASLFLLGTIFIKQDIVERFFKPRPKVALTCYLWKIKNTHRTKGSAAKTVLPLEIKIKLSQLQRRLSKCSTAFGKPTPRQSQGVGHIVLF